MTVTPLNLNPLAPAMPPIAPRSATFATADALDYNAQQSDAFQKSENASKDQGVKQDHYLQARAHQRQLPMWKRILTGAVILGGSIMGSSFLIQTLNKAPAMQKWLFHENPWVRRPARIANFIGEMAIFQFLVEAGTIALEALAFLF